MTTGERALKRCFDLTFSLAGLVALGWLIALTCLIATVETRRFGIFSQERIGLHGRRFRLHKTRTMREIEGRTTTVTRNDDPRITPIGRLLRKTKLDELPQLWDVLRGEMSFVGPRPDVPGFADQLRGEDRVILSVRPGITGPATLRFRNEEELLAAQDDPDRYNRSVIYPEKVRLNREYVEQYSFFGDLYYIYCTLAGRSVGTAS